MAVHKKFSKNVLGRGLDDIERGKGLDALIDTNGVRTQGTSTINEIPLDQIEPNPNQPRREFDSEALQELANSIREIGIIQPITLRQTDEHRFQIIAGERRWRASQLAGLEAIPAYIRTIKDENVMEMALVENIQREDLNAIEVALSLQRLVDECRLTQDSLAERVGKKRSTVANYMRLLRLPVEIQLAIREELISMGHARALAGIESEERQIALLKKIVKKGLSVRQTEELVRQENAKSESKNDDEEFPESYTRLVEELERFFNQNISIRKNNKGGGKIVIGFESDADIEAFIDKFNEFAK